MNTITSHTLGVTSKIHQRHLRRLALVYVRQSTLQQVHRHQESTRLQYGLVERATNLGWAGEQVVVIDDDLGRSGANADGRPGFQRMLAQIGLDQVGIVFGIEMSRLARSCRDWYQLLELCSVYSTLIADLDGVYDPGVYNDRLLLGLKGTMSEAELHLIQQRLHQGRLAKAKRGELFNHVPMGYVRRPSGQVIKDPDEQAQATIALVFDQFERLGTLDGVLRYLVKHSIQMPIRIRSGPERGELQWSRPNRATLSNLLHNPIYAGAYTWGRRPTDPRKKKPGRPSTGRTVAKPDQWQVLLKDRLPAYISWQQYEKNVRQLEQNTSSSRGVVRHGPSLLSGILVCGRCGLRMSVQYNNNGRDLRYGCGRMRSDYGLPLCQSLKGNELDAFVSKLVLRAMEPAALEVSLKVAEDLESERARLDGLWKQRLERSQYEVERAFRQYNSVEPENRLVARTLEGQWETALGAHEKLKTDYANFLVQSPLKLDADDREQLRRLAEDIPALWKAETTTAADRQALVRHLIERVVVTVRGQSEKVDVQIHWQGGHRTGAQLVRPVARLEQLSYYKPLLERVAQLHHEGYKPTQIAKELNNEGWRPAKRRATFTAAMVQTLLARQGLMSAKKRRSQALLQTAPNEWTLGQLAQKLEMPQITLYSWLRKGHLQARRDETHPQRMWLVQADEDELARLRALRQAPRTWSRHVRVSENEQGK